MRLSVVMAVRNGEPYVREAIESVLAQSVTEFEFVIVDDASTDNTLGILSKYQRQDSRICVLRNESNLGPYLSTNRALRRARGNLIARHDADDISPPERFAIQLEALDADAEVCLVTGAVEVFGGNGGQVPKVGRPPSWQPRLEWELLFCNVVGAGAHVMFPRLFRGIPVLFPAQHPYAEDYGLWCSLSRLGRVVCPPQIVYRYRRHGLSITSRRAGEQAECLSQIRHAYQSEYLRSEVARETVVEVSRFWIPDGSRPLAASVPRIHLIFTELRSNFLAYVEQRYGVAARAALATEIDKTFSERLGYWIYRSLRFMDWKACRDLLSTAGASGDVMNVSGQALASGVSAFLGKLSERQRS